MKKKGLSVSKEPELEKSSSFYLLSFEEGLKSAGPEHRNQRQLFLQIWTSCASLFYLAILIIFTKI